MPVQIYDPDSKGILSIHIWIVEPKVLKKYRFLATISGQTTNYNIMKTLIFAALLAITFSSCSKDEYKEPKYCWEFFNDNLQPVLTKCDMTETEANEFKKANGYKGFRKK